MTVNFIVLSSVVLLLIFPIFADLYIAFDKDKKTVKAEISIFKITVFKFNIVINGLKFYIKQSYKRPYIVTLSPTLKKPNFMPKIRRISVLSVDGVYNFGIKDKIFAPLFIVSAINTIESETAKILCYYKPNLRKRKAINLYLGKSDIIVYFRLKAVFNLLDIICNIFYLLSEKIRYAK